MTAAVTGSARDRRRLDKSVRESKAPAISRAAAILRLLGKSETPLTLQSIATTLGLVPSTCLYTLRALVAEELVACEPETKRYSLEAGVLTLARQWLKQNTFPDLVQPSLNELSRDLGVTTLGVQIVGLDHIVVVATSTAAGNFHLSAEVGSRFPALISATGRCIAAFGDYSEAELGKRFATLRWDNPPMFESWLVQVAQTRERGFALDAGNYIDGISVLAAPVWKDHGAPAHAVVALALGADLDAERVKLIGESLSKVARGLSQKLGA
ncbi:MAG: IclR family transcriptional regulator [Halioglobus sp.]|nr:IclR family transcriptional regulator [Halioglobus sp.]